MSKEITIEDFKKTSLIPLGKHMVLRSLKVKSDANIVLPDSVGPGDFMARMAGASVLMVEQLGDLCEKIEVGDYVITKPNAKSLSAFKLLGEDRLLVHEEDITAIMRDINKTKKGEKND